MRPHQLFEVVAVSLVAWGCSGATIGGGSDAGGAADAGTDAPVSEDAGCVAAAEDCNRKDDDCDGEIDEDFDLGSDPDNCGGCGIRCTGESPVCGTLPGGAAACVASCADPTPTRCGEICVDTSTNVAHCGACGNECVAPASASPTCTDGTCGFGCDPGIGDCDGDAGNGCETPLTSLSDCGGWGVGCEREHASETCSTGTCQISSCHTGWGDCDGADANGCETALTSLTNCGACGAVCSRINASETCSTGSCRISSCVSGYGNCDGADANGCETPLTSLTNCGACGVSCSLPNATESCSTGSCLISTCNAGYADCNGIDSDGCECVI